MVAMAARRGWPVSVHGGLVVERGRKEKVKSTRAPGMRALSGSARVPVWALTEGCEPHHPHSQSYLIVTTTNTPQTNHRQADLVAVSWPKISPSPDARGFVLIKPSGRLHHAKSIAQQPRRPRNRADTCNCLLRHHRPSPSSRTLHSSANPPPTRLIVSILSLLDSL